MKFVVAGCGIGGLTVAHALSRLGHNILLLEKSAELKPVGAGISIQPNAMQALKRLDLDRLVATAGWEAEGARVLSDTGKQYRHFDFSNYRDQFGFLPQTIYRGDLIRVLHQSLDDSKTKILLDEEFESFRESDSGIIVTTSKGSIECDALIGSDGIHSKVRNQLWGEVKPIFAGYTCWRGMVTDPHLVNQVETMTEVWGKGARFGFMRCNKDQVYWFATENRSERTDHQGDQSQWKLRFNSWIAPIPKLIDATPSQDIVHNDIVDRDPVFPWGKGKATLLGDAAHAMTPNFGQGGAQAIEDAVVIGVAVDRLSDGQKNLDSAFRSYEKFRHPRTKSLVKGSRQFGRIGQGGNWLFRMIRNHLMPSLPKRFVDKQLGWQCDFERQLAKF